MNDHNPMGGGCLWKQIQIYLGLICCPELKVNTTSDDHRLNSHLHEKSTLDLSFPYHPVSPFFSITDSLF